MQTKKDILIQLINNVDTVALDSYAYYNNDKHLVTACDEFIEILTKCQEMDNE